MTYVPAPTGWYQFGTHAGWDPAPALEFHPRRDPETGDPQWERPVTGCMAQDCQAAGQFIIDGVTLCKMHRKRAYHELCEIYHAEQVAEREERARSARRKARDDEAHRVAYAAAGPSQPSVDVRKGPMRGEVLGGRFEENRRRH